jgi:NSS family neurotransmitter:Na+ symporter
LKKRATFTSRFAFIAASAGAAVGLGNIWKFPYEAGENGGAAFILIYILFVFTIGLSLVISEVVIGKMARKNPVGSFLKLSNKKRWGFVGVMGIIASFSILSFYSVVAGWTIEYFVKAVCNSFEGLSSAELQEQFDSFVAHPIQPVLYGVIFIVLTAIIVLGGVQKGVERFSKFLMPVLFALILFLVIWSFNLEGANEALSFLFNPDFSKINTSTVLSALGQAFFSLSVGAGGMITYGSYIRSKDNLMKSAFQISLLDTSIAILAGMAIFPAVFSFGIEPTTGPSLVFVSLPNIFTQMSGGYIFSVLFFSLLVIAALTSSISLLELLATFLSEELKIKRKSAIFVVTIAAVVCSAICSLSLGEWSGFKFFGKNIFDLLEYSASNILMPLGAIFISLFVGWKVSKSKLVESLTNSGSVNQNFVPYYLFFVRYLVPIAIFMVFLNELL